MRFWTLKHIYLIRGLLMFILICYTFLCTYHYCVEWLKNFLRWPSREFSWINHTAVLIEFNWTWSNAPESQKTTLCPKGVYLTISFWKNTFFLTFFFLLEMTFLAMDFVLMPSQIGFYLKMLLILFSCFGFDQIVVVFLNVGLFSPPEFLENYSMLSMPINMEDLYQLQ